MFCNRTETEICVDREQLAFSPQNQWISSIKLIHDHSWPYRERRSKQHSNSSA